MLAFTAPSTMSMGLGFSGDAPSYNDQRLQGVISILLQYVCYGIVLANTKQRWQGLNRRVSLRSTGKQARARYVFGSGVRRTRAVLRAKSRPLRGTAAPNLQALWPRFAVLSLPAATLYGAEMSYCTLMDHECGPGLIGHLKHCTPGFGRCGGHTVWGTPPWSFED